MTEKRDLRREMRVRRAAVPSEERMSASAAICRNILGRADVQAAVAARRAFAVYLAQPAEIDLSSLIAELKAESVTMAAPRWNGTAYTLARLDDASLCEGPHGIMEPVDDVPVAPGDVGVWIVPGLAFAEDGARLVYGGGWYDRLLSGAAPDATVLGVAYPFQVVDSLPLEPHDIRVTAVVMP